MFVRSVYTGWPKSRETGLAVISDVVLLRRLFIFGVWEKLLEQVDRNLFIQIL